jgi:hypothetical protein
MNYCRLKRSRRTGSPVSSPTRNSPRWRTLQLHPPPPLAPRLLRNKTGTRDYSEPSFFMQQASHAPYSCPSSKFLICSLNVPLGFPSFPYYVSLLRCGDLWRRDSLLVAPRLLSCTGVVQGSNLDSLSLRQTVGL